MAADDPTSADRPAEPPAEPPYADIPGTTVFDMRRSREGYWLNQFCMSLMRADERERFKRDERAYLDEWAMSEAQRRAVLDRDLNRCIALGGNIYFLAKIGATDGDSFQKMAGSMSGMSEEAYRAMMVAGGRSIEGNRRLGEDGDAQPRPAGRPSAEPPPAGSPPARDRPAEASVDGSASHDERR